MGKKKSSEISAAAEFEKELTVLGDMISSLQKQKEKGICRPLRFKEAAEYLGCSYSHLYKLTAAELIPCHKPRGRLFFFQHELEEWVEAGKKHKSHKHSKEDK